MNITEQHDTNTCACEMCRWADEVERREKEKDANNKPIQPS